jgi:hypothetical protein
MKRLPSSLCFLFLGLKSVLAVDYYVSTTGSDVAAGSLAAPWRTVQRAVNQAVAGDSVHVRAGIYAERVTISGKLGTALAPIVIQKYAGDAGAAVLDQTGVNPPTGLSAVVTVQNCDHVHLLNLEVANYKTTGTNSQQRQRFPVGIYVTGSGTGLRLRGCKVHDIWQSCTTLFDFSANAGGIGVYGNATAPITDLVMDGCEVYQLRTGASESVVLNGNVTQFSVTNNVVHDCNNIGIDFIGFEGVQADPLLDQARFGVCRGNVVYRVDTKFNPAYGGNFTTGGGNDTRAAPGLYVDGGRDILMERNVVYDCNFAVSLSSENTGRNTSNVTLRNNIFHHCHVGGIVLGGAGTSNGGTDNCTVTHNTLYQNDTVGYGGGQLMVQHYTTNSIIQRNLMAATSSFVQFIVKANTTGSFAAGSVDWNLYRLPAGSSFEFIWNNEASYTFASWKPSGSLAKDANSSLITSALGLANSAPNVSSPVTDFFLTASSPARDTGDSVAQPFVTAVGERDYAGQSRVASGRVDIGADEFMTPWQAWRDLYWSLPDGGTGAGAMDDPDQDGASNLVEYSQGSSPLSGGSLALPNVMKVPGGLRLVYRKAAAELSYAVDSSSVLPGGWVASSAAEQTDGLGNYWRDVTASGSQLFLRLRITQ